MAIARILAFFVQPLHSEVLFLVKFEDVSHIIAEFFHSDSSFHRQYHDSAVRIERNGQRLKS